MTDQEQIKHQKGNEMDEMQISEKLNQLKDTYRAAADLRAEYERVTSECVPDEVKAKLDAINEQYKPKFLTFDAVIAALEKEIKIETLKYGRSVGIEGWSAIFFKGKIKWDANKLEGYMIAHPEIEPFKKVEEPYVVIRQSPVVLGKKNGDGK